MLLNEFLRKYPKKSFGSVNVKRDYKFGSYVPWESEENQPVIDEGWQIYLNHSCDEWIIGNLKETEKFFQELKEAIEFCKENN